MSRRCQPAWVCPSTANRPVLKLFNSLSRKKDEFVPENGNRVEWYSCGPTVYDASHMGHARSYITFDILRRVLSDYFGYNIHYVMNITDIDDKIIKRARQNFLFERYFNAGHSIEKVLEDAKQALEYFSPKVKDCQDLDKKTMMMSIVSRMETAVVALESAVKNKNGINEKLELLMVEAKDPLSDWLDHHEGSKVSEHSIFATLSRQWENAFHKDMEALNVLPPDVLTRVSEYVPEIVDYVEKIIDVGLAYESNGSVYFDVGKFDADAHHSYAKLVPEAYGDATSLQDGEGDLSVTAEKLNEKRSANDFALWKSSKPGEPAWPSPWGAGRPGWHIECSVMASHVCGPHIDIHTGGVDLKFPHHDNEIAQAEAYYKSDRWVNYFLHSGHLTITGCKMSKSLKNFVTIQDALKQHSSRQLRLAFLLHSWKDTLDYSSNTMDMATQYERTLNEFFLTVKDLIRRAGKHSFVKQEKSEAVLTEKFHAAKEKVHLALCDNVDTRTTLDVIRELIATCNVYLREQKTPDALLLTNIGVFITQIFQVYGVIPVGNAIGFPTGDGNVNREELLMPYLSILSEFRQAVRTQAKQIKANDILVECDRLRDDVLPDVGVRMEDLDGAAAAVKLVDRDELIKERNEKRQLEVEKAAEKEKKRAALAEKAAALEAQKKIKPANMFRTETDKYSKFDDQGLPTHDTEGKELSKGLLKKLLKLQQQQEKKYNEFMEANK